MKIKNLTKLFLLLTFLVFAFVKPSFGILASSRTIDINVSGVNDVDTSELYVLYPTEYIEFVYNNFSNKMTDFTESEKVIYKEIGELINDGKYIEAINFNDTFANPFVFAGEIEDEYFEEDGVQYIKEKFTAENYGKNVLEEFYDENTIDYTININSDYNKSNFKLLIVDEGKENVIDLSDYKFEKLDVGIDNYSMKVKANLGDSINIATTSLIILVSLTLIGIIVIIVTLSKKLNCSNK